MQLTRAALQAANLKDSELAIQIGLTGAIAQANEAAQWLAIQRRMSLDVFDEFKNQEGSFLDGLELKTLSHFKAPPTVHDRCRIHREVPALHQKVGYACVTTSDLENMKPLFNKMEAGTVLTGRIEHIRRVLSEGEFAVQPLYYWKDHIVVRIEGV